MTDKTRLSKYDILEEVGRGGFGVVYKARDVVLNRIVAVKVLHPNLVNDPGFVSRFRNEARLAAQLEHPNLVPVHDLGQEDGRYYITMAYMAGGSLKDKLKEGALSEESLWKTFPQLLRGLEVIHENGIVHRDLKPGNILFDQYEIARISDLGFAKALHADSSVSLSMTGGMIGTPAYMAPEVWRGNQASVRSDIYSLGCILYEILTGEVLFEGETPAMAMTKHLVDRPQYKHKLPDGWHDLLDKCLAMDPNNRYADVQALHEASNLLLTDEETEPEFEIPVVIENLPLRERFQSFLRHLETTTQKEVQAEEVSASEEAISEQKAKEPELLTEEAQQNPEIADHQIARREQEQGGEELERLPEKKENRKWMLYASLVMLALSMIVLSFSLLKGNKHTAAVPVATETPTREPSKTPTKMPTKQPSKTPTKTPTPKPTLTPTHALIIGSTMTRVIDNMEMVFVPSGDFTMGSDEGEEDEKPIRHIYLDAYWIDKYEVSNSQYARCVEMGVCTEPSQHSIYARARYYGNPDFDNFPVVMVNWQQAQTYCEWAGGSLPTEAQWEKAARGTDGRTYPWGEESPTCKLVNYATCFGNTNSVTGYEEGASPYGVLNMAGNVWEWVHDWYGPYEEGETNNPVGPSLIGDKVARGGSWVYIYKTIRTTQRWSLPPAIESWYFGFRCAVPER